MPTAEQWLDDMPQQFAGKKNIETLVKAFSGQMDEVLQVFTDMGLKLDINTAEGKNLDNVGTIIPLSRKEAGELAGAGVSEPVLSDDRYRQVLKYKLLGNTSDGTYYDIIEGLEYLYDFQFFYREDARFPATVILSMPLELDGPDLLFRRHLCIRPGGVGLFGEKKFAAFYAVPVKYGNRVTFTGSFHPRPELFLNGEAGLDGVYCLDGFFDSRQEDLYPVVFSAYGDILLQTRHAARYRLQTETRETVYHGLQICIHGDAGKQAESESSACISASAKENIATGERLVIEKDLWYLDGEQMLDGSVCLDADIYEEPL